MPQQILVIAEKEDFFEPGSCGKEPAVRLAGPRNRESLAFETITLGSTTKTCGAVSAAQKEKAPIHECASRPRAVHVHREAFETVTLAVKVVVRSVVFFELDR